MSELVSGGIIPAGLPYDTTDDSMYYGFCGNPFNKDPPNGASYPPGTEECTKTYLNGALTDAFNSQCAGNTECTFSATNYAINSTTNGTDQCTTNPAKVYL